MLGKTLKRTINAFNPWTECVLCLVYSWTPCVEQHSCVKHELYLFPPLDGAVSIQSNKRTEPASVELLELSLFFSFAFCQKRENIQIHGNLQCLSNRMLKWRLVILILSIHIDSVSQARCVEHLKRTVPKCHINRMKKIYITLGKI